MKKLKRKVIFVFIALGLFIISFFMALPNPIAALIVNLIGWLVYYFGTKAQKKEPEKK